VPAPAPQPLQVVAPDPVSALKMVWTVMSAVDQANITGNYSVLRDLGAPSFQANNNAATLGAIFQNIRTQRIDLGNTLLVTPIYDIGPVIVEGGMLRIRGVFPLRPSSIAFDLLFQPVGGRWALFGVAVAPVAPTAPAPAGAPRR
jgi:hypothetical protein